MLDFAQRLGNLAFGSYIDVQVADHCNLGCRGCLHFAPIAEPRFLDLAEYELSGGRSGFGFCNYHGYWTPLLITASSACQMQHLGKAEDELRPHPPRR